MNRCEAATLPKARGWASRPGRCKRSATITVDGRRFCEQHAKFVVGMAADVRLSARDLL